MATGGIGLAWRVAAVCAIAMPAAHAQDAPAAAVTPEAPARFFIEAFDVAGNTLLEPGQIERAVYPFLGPDRSIADVEAAIAALTALYAARGYQSVGVAVAGTTANDRIVQLAVTEARLGRVTVAGNRYVGERAIRRSIPALVEGEVPDLAAAQRQLGTLDRIADRRVTPEITPGAVPGTLDVVLRVDDDLPYHAGATLSNDHAPNTSDLRLSFNARATDLWQRGHTLSLAYLIAPERREDAEVISGSYLAPIGGSAWSVLVFGYKSNSDIALLGGANVLGDGYAIGVRGILALPSFGSFTHSVNFGFDYKDFNESTNVPDTDLIRAPVRYIPLAATYTVTRSGAKSAFNGGIGVTAGVRAFNERISPGFEPDGRPVPPESIFANRRVGARENFVHVNVDADYTRTLGGPDGREAEVLARVAAQYANGPLISNEQFSAGGLSSVRGYLQSEAVADDGVSGTFELRSPAIAAGWALQALRLYGFVDGAYLQSRRPQPEEQYKYTLISVGVGARLEMLRFLSGDVVLGLPLSNSSDSRNPEYTETGDANVFFSVKGEF